jgi:catechol 2,3-dioxygenase-like lactoylglutathione lyase family enzyme
MNNHVTRYVVKQKESQMFDHVSIGVADIARSKKFYDAALKPLGFMLLSDGESSLGYGDKAVQLWLGATKKPVKADMESGLHFCFAAKDRAAVDAFHAAAVKAGGTDNGKPGVRADYGPKYYAAFAVDPDGYRIEAYCGK